MMSREDWIDNRADEIYAKWIAAYPILRRNEDALSDIALSEAAAEFEAACEEAAIARTEALAEDRENEGDYRWDYV